MASRFSEETISNNNITMSSGAGISRKRVLENLDATVDSNDPKRLRTEEELPRRPSFLEGIMGAYEALMQAVFSQKRDVMDMDDGEVYRVLSRNIGNR